MLDAGQRLRRMTTAMWVAIATTLSCDLSTPPGAPPSSVPPVVPPPTTTPPPTAPPQTGGPLRPAPPFPTVANATAIYLGPEDLYDIFSQWHESRLATRFVFFGDSTFELQFSSYRFGFFRYPGRVAGSDTVLALKFSEDGESATGILRGDSLAVRYPLMMQMSDFLDGVYLRQR